MAYAPGIDLGTPKEFTSVVAPLSNFNPAAGWTTLDLAPYTPAGTKAVYVDLQFVSSAASDYMIVAQTSALSDRLIVVHYSHVANVIENDRGIIKLTAARTLAYYANNIRITNVYLELGAYYL
jgi:hypothetical protein